MIARIRTPAGRLFLLGTGILLTSTAGHATARMIAAHMALERPGFAFELAMLIAILLVAVHIGAFYFRKPLEGAAVRAHEAVQALPAPMLQTQEVPALPSPEISKLRLPAGLRLDSNDAIMITGGGHPERKILHVNAAFARLTGFRPSEWIGRSGDLLLADGPLRMESLQWLDAGEDGRELHWIARLHRRDGTLFCAEAHLYPMQAKNGAIDHVVLLMTDVTRRTGNGKSREPSALDAVGEIRQSA